MTLAETLRQKLAEWQPGDGRHELSVSDPGTGWNASLTSDHADAARLSGLGDDPAANR